MPLSWNCFFSFSNIFSAKERMRPKRSSLRMTRCGSPGSETSSSSSRSPSPPFRDASSAEEDEEEELLLVKPRGRRRKTVEKNKRKGKGKGKGKGKARGSAPEPAFTVYRDRGPSSDDGEEDARCKLLRQWIEDDEMDKIKPHGEFLPPTAGLPPMRAVLSGREGG